MESGRTPTGIYGLDPIIGGGFPKGSLILVAGNPGTGKTIFSAQFLYYGATEFGEKGIYVSFAESRNAFFSHMLDFGFDFEKLEREGKFKFLDMVTVKEEGVSTLLEMILSEVHALGAKRLVVDSFSTLINAFKQPIDARIVIHTVLSKIVRQVECTTLLIVEMPMGTGQVGLGVEEFVADGVITLKRVGAEGGINVREIEISKLRGARLPQSSYMFTLEGGFHVLSPFVGRKIEKAERWKPIPDTETHFSSGSQDLDRVLGGGYTKGSYVILEADTAVPFEAIRLFELPLAYNFISQSRGVAIIPSGGTDSEEIRKLITPYVGEEAFAKYVKIYEEVKPGKDQLKPWIALMKGGATNLERDAAAWLQVQVSLRESTGQPVLALVGFDTLESRYAENPEKLFSEIGLAITECKAQGNLTLAVARPGLRITQRALNMVDWHLRLMERYGCILFYGVKPRTGIYAIDCDVSSGYPTLRLVPMV